MRDVEVERVLESEMMREELERGYYVEMVGGLGSREVVIEKRRGIGGKRIANEADMEGKRDGEREKGRDKGVGVVGERSGVREGLL